MLRLILALAAALLLGIPAASGSFDNRAPLLAAPAYAAQSAEPGYEDIDPETYTVYITKTGEKYHRDACRYLKKSRIATTLAEARKKYTACKVCKPPA